MKEQTKKIVSLFHKKEKDGRIHAELLSLAGGLAVRATILRDETIVAELMRYSKDGVSNLDVLTDEAILDALILAGISEDADESQSETTSATLPVVTKEIAEDTTGDASPVVVEGKTDDCTKGEPGPAAKTTRKRRGKKASTDADAVAPVETAPIASGDADTGKETVDEDAADTSKTMTLEEARAVILEIKNTAEVRKKVESSAIGSYVGQPLGELERELPSFIKAMAARAGTASSTLTPETDDAIKVIAAAMT